MKIKNVLLSGLFIVFLMAGTTASAQLRIGLRGEVGLNKPVFNESVVNVENLNGFKVGPSVEFMFPVLNLGVDASVMYNNESMNVKTIGNMSNMKISNHYIDIPVNLKYKFGIISPLKVYVAAGPYAKIRVGSDELKFSNINLDADFDDLIESKPIEAGINLGLGADIINRVQIGFSYGIKLTDNFYSEKDDLIGDNGLSLLKALNGKKGTWSLNAAVYF